MVYLHHTYLLVTPSASFGYFIRIFFTNNTVFFTESYGHFMQINRIFAIIQPPFQANRRLLKNRQESKSDLSTNKWQKKDLSPNIMIKAIIYWYNNNCPVIWYQTTRQLLKRYTNSLLSVRMGKSEAAPISSQFPW